MDGYPAQDFEQLTKGSERKVILMTHLELLVSFRYQYFENSS